MELWFTEKHTEDVQFSIRMKEQLYHGISEYQTIDFYDSFEFGKILVLDGAIMVTERDEFIYHEMMVHVPLATNPLIKNVLVIGGGDGGTVRELTRYKTIDRIDMVEIDEKVVSLSKKYLPLTASKLDDIRVNVFYEDGVSYVMGLEEEYDLIIVDSTDPYGPGEGLFSRAFYENCVTALTKDGILVNQHENPYYKNNAKEMRRFHQIMNSTFSISKVYQFHMPTYPSGYCLFGFSSKTLDPEKVDFEKWLSYNIQTNYYNIKIHHASFVLPMYVQKLLEG